MNKGNKQTVYTSWFTLITYTRSNRIKNKVFDSILLHNKHDIVYFDRDDKSKQEISCTRHEKDIHYCHY